MPKLLVTYGIRTTSTVIDRYEVFIMIYILIWFEPIINWLCIEIGIFTIPNGKHCERINTHDTL